MESTPLSPLPSDTATENEDENMSLPARISVNEKPRYEFMYTFKDVLRQRRLFKYHFEQYQYSIQRISLLLRNWIQIHHPELTDEEKKELHDLEFKKMQVDEWDKPSFPPASL